MCEIVLNSVWSIELHHVKPDGSELDLAEPNQGLQCQIIWDLLTSEILRSLEFLFHTIVSGQPIEPSFKGQEIQKHEES
jgi:hypothetical protein